MGLSTSNLRGPWRYHGYHVYLIKPDLLTGIAKDLSDRFDLYGDTLGNHMILKPGNNDIYEENLQDLLEKEPHLALRIKPAESLPAGVIVTNPPFSEFPYRFQKLFIYASGEVLNLAYSSKNTLFRDLTNLCNNDTQTFLVKLAPYARKSIIEPSKSEDEKFIQAVKNNFHPKFGLGIAEFDAENFYKEIRGTAPLYDCFIWSQK